MVRYYFKAPAVLNPTCKSNHKGQKFKKKINVFKIPLLSMMKKHHWSLQLTNHLKNGRRCLMIKSWLPLC